MALTTKQLEEVLSYAAFQTYDAPQKKALSEKLTTSNLEYLQIAVLFGDDASGGMIHSLVEDSQDSDEAARQLGKIIANINESINPDYGYAPTPIIQNMIGRLGSIPFNKLTDDAKEALFNDVKWLTRQHVTICNARVIENTPPAANQQADDVVGVLTPSTTNFLSLVTAAIGAPAVGRLFAEIERLPNLHLGGMLIARPGSHIDYDGRVFGTHTSLIINPQNLPLGADWHGNHLGPQRGLGEAAQQHGFFGVRQQTPAQQVESLELLNRLTARIMTNPRDLDARFQRARLRRNLTVSFRNALQDYNYILEREPNNVTALLGRAKLNEDGELYGDNDGDAESALVDYRHVLEIEPQNELALAGVERLTPSAARPE